MIILKSETPANLAASTKSSSRKDKNRLLTVLASLGQLNSDMMMVIAIKTCVTDIPGGIAADNAIQRGKVGNEDSTSIIRWMTVSTIPP